MSLMRWTLLIAMYSTSTLAGCASAPAVSSGANGSAGPPAAAASGTTRSSMSGVYSEAQSTRGKDVYMNMCVSCHTPASQTGPLFTRDWEGRPVSAFFTYISNEMPKSDPGSLAPREYADIVSYVMSLNGMPPGSAELPPDTLVMKTIRFDTKDP